MTSLNENKVVILGAGISGLAAAYFLKEANINSVIYEKNGTYGGLCNSFVIDGFTFDTFAHLTFSKDKEVNNLLEGKTEYLKHQPEAVNFFNGRWLRNPVQTNLYGLNLDEKIKIIEDFVNKPNQMQAMNYESWLRMQYGNYFAEQFPMKYTRKYWTVEANQLDNKWVEGRMYSPSLQEVLTGAMSKETPCVHYSKEMHYPAAGGYKNFLKPLAVNSSIKYNKKVSKIDTIKKSVQFEDGETVAYQQLISTIPLPELPAILTDMPQEVREACNQLDYTSGIILSLGFRRKVKNPALWFYIYDEDIYPSRVYYPGVKSDANVPEGCSSLQAEIYYSKYKPLTEEIEIMIEKTIARFIEMGLFHKQDVIVKDVRIEKYANVMFTPAIYKSRDRVHRYLEEKGILYAGRFGEWDYLWTDQSLLSGKTAAEKLK